MISGSSLEVQLFVKILKKLFVEFRFDKVIEFPIVIT